MASTLEEILARWDSGEGKPFKGSLIDWSAYDGDGTETPANVGCMCAQGQVLHLFGGWEPKRLQSTEQSKADAATAKLLNISRAHSILLRNVNDSIDGAPSIVLNDPSKVLGDQWSVLLDFWWHLDHMTAEQWDAAWVAAWDAAWDAARVAARVAAWVAARVAAWDAAWVAAWDAARVAAAYAGGEIMGARVLRAEGKPFFFLPLFGFSSPEEIPARPADYGLGVVPVGMTS